MSVNLDHVILDVETRRNPDDLDGPGDGWEATHKMGVAVAVTWCAKEGYVVWGPDAVEDLMLRLARARRVTGWNSWRFDLPVVFGVPRQLWLDGVSSCASLMISRSDDLLQRLWSAADASGHGRLPDGASTLDAVAWQTLGVRMQERDHAAAPADFEAGRWDLVTTMCIEDVEVTRELCRFADEHGYLVAGGRRLEIPPWEPKSGG